MIREGDLIWVIFNKNGSPLGFFSSPKRAQLFEKYVLKKINKKVRETTFGKTYIEGWMVDSNWVCNLDEMEGIVCTKKPAYSCGQCGMNFRCRVCKYAKKIGISAEDRHKAETKGEGKKKEYIYFEAYDPKMRRRVVHEVKDGLAISLMTGHSFHYLEKKREKKCK